MFERIVYDHLYNFLNSEEIISKQQSGFRSLHSTVTALLEATDSWAFNVIGFAAYGQLRVGQWRFSAKPNFPSFFIFTSKFFEMQEVDQSKLQVGGFVFILNAPIKAFQRKINFPCLY